MQGKLKAIADHPRFQNFITLVIILAGILVGIETYEEFAHRHHGTIWVLDQFIIWIFVTEVVVKMGAEGSKPWRYFFDPWNVFDFIIVVACFLPVNAQYVMVLRLARLLRVLKLVRALPRLQILVGALLKAIPSMAYVSLLLGMLFYVYAVAGTFMFSKNDPIHFSSLPLSMLSLFRAVTLEDWTDLMYINMYGCDNYGYDGNEHLCTEPSSHPLLGAAFFVSLILIGTMVVLNLFIGVIMSGMDAAQNERDLEEAAARREALGDQAPSVADEIGDVNRELVALQEKLALVLARAKKKETELERVRATLNATPTPGE